jgi:uncharacterized protein with PQ loop repeat
MVHQTGLHHYHKRKGLKTPRKWKKFIDNIIYAVVIIGPITVLPQLFKIWIHKSAADVSALSWAAFTLLSAIWLLYGLAHKDKPIIINSALWVVLDLLIVIGAVMYS